MLFIVHLQPCIPLQILCLQTSIISLPQAMSAFCADLEFNTSLAVFTTFSTNNLIYKRKKENSPENLGQFCLIKLYEYSIA